MIYMADKTKDISLGHSISGTSERLPCRCKGYIYIYIHTRVLQQRPGRQTIKRLLLRLTDIENRLMVTKGGGEMDGNFGVSRCKLLDLEWISNEVLLYSIGNYIQLL